MPTTEPYVCVFSFIDQTICMIDAMKLLKGFLEVDDLLDQLCEEKNNICNLYDDINFNEVVLNINSYSIMVDYSDGQVANFINKLKVCLKNILGIMLKVNSALEMRLDVFNSTNTGKIVSISKQCFKNNKKHVLVLLSDIDKCESVLNITNSVREFSLNILMFASDVRQHVE